MQTTLMEAAKKGDVVTLINLLASRPKLLYLETPNERNTALHIAASNGHDWFVHHFLFYMNLDVEIVVRDNSDGDTPLHLAVKAGHLKVVENLTRYVAWARNIQKNLKEPLIVQNKKGNAVLHESVIHKRNVMATMLLEDAKKVNLMGSTVRGTISMDVEDDNVVFRLDHVILILKNADKDTPLHLAVKHHLFDMAVKLLEGPKEVKLMGGTPEVIASNHVEDANEVFRMNHVLVIQNADKDTPLHLAVKHHMSDMAIKFLEEAKEVKLVLWAPEARADINEEVVNKVGMDHVLSILRNADEDTPLHLAVKQRMYDLAIKLFEGSKKVTLMSRTLEAIAGIHVQDENKAVRINDVLLLLRNVDKDTPLVLAVKAYNAERHTLHPEDKADYFEMTQMFIRCDQEMKRELTTRKHAEMLGMDSALRKAADKGDMATLINLLASNPHAVYTVNDNQDTALHIAARAGHLAIIEHLLQYMGQNVELILSKNHDGDTPLHLALRARHFAVIERLIWYMVEARKIKVNLQVPRMDSALRKAAEKGDVVSLTKLLDSNPNLVYTVTNNQDTALHIAARAGHVAVIKHLLQYMGKNVELILSQNHDGDTPLHLALSARNVAVIECLIRYIVEARKIQVNIQMPRMDSALRKAADNADVASLINLLASNPNAVYTVTDNQDTALHIAARAGHLAVIEHLLNYMGQNVELILSQNNDGDTPLHLAVRGRHVAVIERLIQYMIEARKVQVNLQEPLIMVNSEGNNLLHEAVMQDLLHVADLLLESTKEGKWRTPKAIFKEYDAYIDHDVQINDVLDIWRFVHEYHEEGQGPLTMQNKKGNNPVHAAVMHRMSDMALKLLDADPRCGHMPNAEMQSPFYIAVVNGLDHVVNKIAKQDLSVASVSISAHGTAGTALHQAVLADNIRALEILLNKYVKLLRIPDSEGNYPLHYAASINNEEMVSMLLNKDFTLAYMQNKKLQTPLHSAVEKGSLEAVKVMLKHSPDISEMVDNMGRNAFHIAVIYENVKVLKWLLRWLPGPGELVNQQDINGDTPLHLATKKSNIKGALLLLKDPRVDPCVTNREGHTALAISERIGILLMDVHDEWNIRTTGPSSISWSMSLWKQLKKREAISKQRRGKIQSSKQQDERDSYGKNMVRIYILVATLIAMATYTAALRNQLSAFAVIRHHVAFKIFVICNTVSMCSSTVLIIYSTGSLRHLHGLIWASRLIVLAGLTMVMSMLAMLYLTVAPRPRWLAIA
ncbi:hypothetical protein ACP70R_047197 [Stipagrostis hirtigluma subsp. patula]